MPLVFPDRGLTVVPTGSLGIVFRNDGETMPDEITVSAMNQSLGETVLLSNYYGFTPGTPLQILSSDYESWKVCELTSPLQLDQSYVINVDFDGDTVYSETIDIPASGRRRSRVLRQRIYEVLLAGYALDKIAVLPFGNGQYPDTIDQDFKSVAVNVIEVGPAFMDGLTHFDYRTQTSSVNVPLRLYGAMDGGEDTEDLASDMEEMMSYLMATDWRLNAFGLIQSSATFEGGEPEINEDRKMAVIRGSLNVNMRMVI